MKGVTAIIPILVAFGAGAAEAPCRAAPYLQKCFMRQLFRARGVTGPGHDEAVDAYGMPRIKRLHGATIARGDPRDEVFIRLRHGYRTRLHPARP